MVNQTEFLKKIKEAVQSVDQTAKVYLYGSRARGDAKPGSDWDILILTNDDKLIVPLNKKQSIRRPVYKIELESGEMLSLFYISKAKWQHPLFNITPFYQNVINEGFEI